MLILALASLLLALSEARPHDAISQRQTTSKEIVQRATRPRQKRATTSAVPLICGVPSGRPFNLFMPDYLDGVPRPLELAFTGLRAKVIYNKYHEGLEPEQDYPPTQFTFSDPDEGACRLNAGTFHAVTVNTAPTQLLEMINSEAENPVYCSVSGFDGNSQAGDSGKLSCVGTAASRALRYFGVREASGFRQDFQEVLLHASDEEDFPSEQGVTPVNIRVQLL